MMNTSFAIAGTPPAAIVNGGSRSNSTSYNVAGVMTEGYVDADVDTLFDADVGTRRYAAAFIYAFHAILSQEQRHTTVIADVDISPCY